MRQLGKSYWIGVSFDTERDRAAILSWFSPLCEGMTPIKAEVMCDTETDREKKFRVVMRDKDGRERIATRTKTRGGWTIELKRAA